MKNICRYKPVFSLYKSHNTKCTDVMRTDLLLKVGTASSSKYLKLFIDKLKMLYI